MSCLLVAIAGYTQSTARASAAENPECLANAPHELVTVRRVTDGDTIVLTDNRRVRIIGINTPELRTSSGRTQAFAIDARTALEKLLSDADKVKLFAGIDSHDRHKRLLAHVQVPGERQVAELMLENGYAAYSAVAPNTRCATQFQAIELHARDRAVGLWGRQHAWQIGDKPLLREHSGFRIVSGQVSAVSTSSSPQQLHLSNGLTLSVKASLSKNMQLQSLRGQQVEIRGWLTRRGNKLHVFLHHPVNLRVINSENNVVSD